MSPHTLVVPKGVSLLGPGEGNVDGTPQPGSSGKVVKGRIKQWKRLARGEGSGQVSSGVVRILPEKRGLQDFTSDAKEQTLAKKEKHLDGQHGESLLSLTEAVE